MYDKRVRTSLITVVLYFLTALLFILCLILSSLSIAYSNMFVDSILYSTGRGPGTGTAGAVELDVNGGDAVIEGATLGALQPGMSEERPFYLQNESSEDVWYRIYFTEIEGALADVVEVEIRLRGELLYSGILGNMTRENTAAADDILHLRERRDFTVKFSISPDAGNEYQRARVSFRLTAEITQVRNNPDRLF